MAIEMNQVLNAWETVSELHYAFLEGASISDVDEAEERLGRRLPDELRTLYERYDGGEFIGSNIVIKPVSELGQLPPSLRDVLRMTFGEGTPIPPAFQDIDLDERKQTALPKELIEIGSDGSDSQFGIWAPATGGAKSLVIEIVEFSADDLDIVGETLGAFLAARSAYYILTFREESDGWEEALDLLGVPDELRGDPDEDETLYQRLMKCVSPNFPVKTPDPYARGWTAAQIAEFARL